METSIAQKSDADANQPGPISKNKVIWLVSLAILFFVSIVWIWSWLNKPDVLPVRSIKVQGNFVHIDKQNLQNIILPFMNKGLIGVDISGLKSQLQQIPWVYSVTVWRVWPDTIKVHLEEQQPIARWGIQDLLNHQGEVFFPGKIIPIELPQLNGPLGEQKIVLQNFQQMSNLLATLQLKITSLTLTTRHAWWLQLNDGTILILGRDNPLERLQRFVKAYPQIITSPEHKIDYVDLRYNHGIAIHWRTNNESTFCAEDKLK